MFGINKCLLYKTTRHSYFLSPMLFSGIIFASSAIFAGTQVNTEKYTLHREKSPEVAPPLAQDEERPEIEILEQSGAYHIKVVAVIDAPADHVRSVLTDFLHIYRLNPSIVESDVVQTHDDESVSVRTRVIGCAAYFCEELERVERVRVLPSGDLRADIVPEKSQFKSGQALWRIKALGDRCEVSYIADMEPDIFIPPVVGKFLIKKSLREEMLTSFANLEKISRIMADREWREDYRPIFTELMVPADPCIRNIEATEYAFDSE